MPISTPTQAAAEHYSGDIEHFKHVLNELIVPAVEKADLTPTVPIAKGADLIHAEIIKNLEEKDLVLCDMSCLNPNVFFELGIRTALNKPVCLIKDDKTSKIPFDMSIINFHEYSTASWWKKETIIEDLSKHITETLERNGTENPLWKYFSMRTSAKPLEQKPGAEGELEALTMEVQAMRKQLQNKDRGPLSSMGKAVVRACADSSFDPELYESFDTLQLLISLQARKSGNKLNKFIVHGLHHLEIFFQKPPTKELHAYISELAAKYEVLITTGFQVE